MSLSSFSLVSLRTHKKAKSMFLHSPPEIEINTSFIKQIGNYKLGEEIGNGAFGKVILGFHIITGEKVAIKILDKIILSQTPEDYELVKQELNILKIVKHKYIVQLYEILETAQHIFIIMEYCEGQDIMDYILARTRLSEEESLKYFQQLINALYYLHSQNITHRDIKIDNLLLDKNLDLKLIDFGLSTKYRDDKLLNQPCGTVVYAAPEVLDCKEYHGMLADVWSSGIVLFGMLSGFLPFGDPDDEVNKKLVLQGRIEIPKFFSREATDLLKHMLDINPLTRYTLEEIMAHPWFNRNRFKLIPGIIIGINKIPIDEKILDLCVTYNADREKVRSSVINNKFNPESALYYLLVKKYKNCGNDSISDLSSNKFIKYILDEMNGIDYINQIQNNFNINEEKILKLQKEVSKDKESNKDRIKIINQINDYMIDYNYNFKGKDKEINLSAAPGLLTDVNYNNKKYNYNLISIENNYSSNNDSRNYDDNYDSSDLINININDKDHSSYEDSKLAINLGETESFKNETEKNGEEEIKNDKIDKNEPITQRCIKTIRNKIIGLDDEDYNEKEKEKEKEKENKYNKSAINNSKKAERYICYKGQRSKLIENVYKNNLIKKNSKKFQVQPPLTSRNASNKYRNNENSSFLMNINSTQVSNYKSKNKIVPIPKEFYKRINLKGKENTTKLILKPKNMPDKKETLTKDLTKKYLKQSKIGNTIINIPPLDINYINKTKKSKISYKKIFNKRKHLNTNIYENPNNIYNKFISNFNKSIDSRNKINTQRNNELNGNLFKTIYNKNISNTNTNTNNNTINADKSVSANNHNHLKQFFKNKLNSRSNENRKKYIVNSISKEKKINKANVLNLIDNFHLYQMTKNNNNMNKNKIDKNASNNSNINKSNINKTSVINYNNKYYNSKKEFSYVKASLLTLDLNNNNFFLDEKNKNNGFYTDRTKNIYNLKKQSCFEKDNNIYMNYNNSNYVNKKKYRTIISNSNNSHLAIKTNKNDLIKIKLKDYHIKRKKIDNLNIKDINNASSSTNATKVNNSILQTANNYTNQLSTKNNNSSAINAEKSHRINVSLKNRSIKKRNLNKLYKKVNTSISSSNNKLKENGRQKTKTLNPKINSIDNNKQTKNNNSTLKIGFVPNYKIKANLSLSKGKNKSKNKNMQNKKNFKNNHHLESSVIVYRKKSLFKIRDLSDSPRQKYLNEKTRNNRIPWKIKKKGIDDKLDSVSIYNKYMKHLQLKSNNPFKKRNLLKKNNKYNKKSKDQNASSFLNNSKYKTYKHSLIPLTVNQKILNISFTNNDKSNKEKEKESYYCNNNNINNISNNGAAKEIYEKEKEKEKEQSEYMNSNNELNNTNENISNLNNLINKKKEVDMPKYKKLKQGKKLKILNNHRRNDGNLNFKYDNYLLHTYENTYHIKDNNVQYLTTKNLTKSKKKFKQSISFASFQSLNDDDKKGTFDRDFEPPFDLSCVFITNRKINECLNIIGNRLRNSGININLKNNLITFGKNGGECQISISKIFSGLNCLLKDRKNKGKYIICYKALDKKFKNNKNNDIFPRLIMNGDL